jgi:acylphosphatase
MNDQEKKYVKVRISGRVQGVGFRYNTRNQAKRLGVRGWVRNEADGTVRVEAEGNAGSVDKFVNWLKQGPTAARVRDIDVREAEYQGIYPRFTIEG